jgi:hypothetical protein
VTSASRATPGRLLLAMPCNSPWRNRAPPTPPDSTVIRRRDGPVDGPVDDPVDDMANSLPQGVGPVWTTPSDGGPGLRVYQTRA